MMSNQKFDGVMSLIGGFSIHLTLGTLYCFGNMSTYMTSYLRKHVHPNITYSDMVWIPTLATVGQGLFMTLSGYLEDFIGVRFTVMCGSALMTTGVYLTAISIQTSVLLTILTYGLMFGVGIALAYAPPMGVAMRWFPRQKGLVNGVIVGGFGLGAFVFNQIQSTYLNPENSPLDPDGYFSDDSILDRVPSVFLLLGSIYGVIQALAVLLISTPPDSSDAPSMMPLIERADAEEEEEEEEELVLNSDEGQEESSNWMTVIDPTVADDNNVRPGLVVRTSEFWILWFTFFLNTQAITYINSMYKAFGQEFIDDDHFLAVVGAVAAVFNSTGRLFWGQMCDAFGYRRCMMFVTGWVALLYATLELTPTILPMALGGAKAAFAIWVWSIFFCFCASFVLLPTASAQCFGTKYSSKNYGLVITGQAAASPLTALLTQLLSPAIGFTGMFIVIAVFSVASTFLQSNFPAHPSPRNIKDRFSAPSPL